MSRFLSALLATAAVVAGCADDAPTDSEVARGRAVFTDPSISTSSSNVFSCATCHATDEGASTRTLSGATLAGVVRRTSFWGGREDDLLTAINRCRSFFMDTPTPWLGTEPEARELYTFLASLPDAVVNPVQFTVPPVARLPDGRHDAVRGEEVYTRACAICHGALHTGRGGIAPLAPKLPDETLREHVASYAESERPIVFVEKTRHGPFFQYGGVMPPFSVEVMPDDDLSSLLAYLGF